MSVSVDVYFMFSISMAILIYNSAYMTLFSLSLSAYLEVVCLSCPLFSESVAHVSVWENNCFDSSVGSLGSCLPAAVRHLSESHRLPEWLALGGLGTAARQSAGS